MSELNPKEIEDYLNGTSDSKETMERIDQFFIANEDNADQLANSLATEEITSDTAIAINHVGELIAKERLSKLNDQLEKEGFFLNEEDIEAYFNKTLEDPKLWQMEQRIARDDAFSEHVDSFKLILQGVDKLGDDETKAKLDDIHEDATRKKSAPYISSDNPRKVAVSGRVKMIRLISTIASAAVIVFGIFYYFNLDNQGSVASEGLVAFNDNYSSLEQPVPNYLWNFEGSMGFANEEKLDAKLLQQAVGMYHDGRFKEAQALLLNIKDPKKKFTAKQLYLGLIDSELEKGNEAILSYDLVIESGQADLRPIAHWYKGLELLRAGNSKDALIQFEILQRSFPAWYAKKVKTLINKLGE